MKNDNEIKNINKSKTKQENQDTYKTKTKKLQKEDKINFKTLSKSTEYSQQNNHKIEL